MVANRLQKAERGKNGKIFVFQFQFPLRPFTVDDPERGYVDYYENTDTVEINVIAGEVNVTGQIVIRTFYNNRSVVLSVRISFKTE